MTLRMAGMDRQEVVPPRSDGAAQPGSDMRPDLDACEQGARVLVMSWSAEYPTLSSSLSRSPVCADGGSRVTSPAQMNSPGAWALDLATFLLVVAILMSFALSAQALAAGVQYISPDGPLWQKSTRRRLFAGLALLFMVIGQPQPPRYVGGLLRKFPGAAFFTAMWMLLTAYGVLIQKAPLTALIEPYLLALVALLLHDELSSATQSFLRKALHGIVVVNALVGVFEIATQSHLFPQPLGLSEIDGRATAIFGHPFLERFDHRRLSPLPVPRRQPQIEIRPARSLHRRFATRPSGLWRPHRAGRGFVHGHLRRPLEILPLSARCPRRTHTPRRRAGVSVIGRVLGVVGVAESGMFDTVFARFVDDNGSGEARLIALQLFEIFDTSDLLFGPRPDALKSTLNMLGIEVRIESTWLALIFLYGAVMAGFFSVGLFVLHREYWRRARSGAFLLFFYVIVTISASIGLASKTLGFVQFSILVLYLFWHDPEPQSVANAKPTGN